MEHCASYQAIEGFLDKKRRLNHTGALLYYDLATTCGEKGLADEADLLDYWAGEEAKMYQDPAFVKAVKEGLEDPKATTMEQELFHWLYEQVALLDKLPLE